MDPVVKSALELATLQARNKLVNVARLQAIKVYEDQALRFFVMPESASDAQKAEMKRVQDAVQVAIEKALATIHGPMIKPAVDALEVTPKK